jgi:predicted AAA+ superfamily ATPase
MKFGILYAMYIRTLKLKEKVLNKSHFLLGARQTGKSTLIDFLFPDARKFNLLAADTFRQLSANPELIRQSLNKNDKIIIIDEVQKLPAILDEVHLMIESNKNLRFVLTGSSARKLKRGGANLLAGRAWTEYLFPLTSCELQFNQIEKLLLVGGLPSVFDSVDPWRELREYVGVYLQEEIRAESLTRSIEAFSRFLSVAGLANGEQINFTKIGNDAQVPARTIREFYSVLVDTLVGYSVEPLATNRKRKSVSTNKFYFFDIGVAHALQGISQITPSTPQYGKAVEHLIANELRACLSYHSLQEDLNYWRSLSQFEVDFVIGNHLAVEVKSGGRVRENDAKGLRALSQESKFRHRIIVSSEPFARKLADGIEVLPIKLFLERLWNGDFWR